MAEVVCIQVVERGSRQAAQNIRRVGREAQSSVKFLGLLRAGLVVFASARVLRGFTDLADSFTNIQNRLRLVTNNAEELTAVTQSLFEVSQRTRANFEGTATVFARVARSTLDLGLNFNELLAVTETVNQTVAISGVTAEAARNALVQFGQGLAAGALRGDELRSVVEQLPELANVIGREFNVAGGELIAFAKANEGVLETERIIRALQAAAPGVAERFAELTPTISQAFEVFNNALVRFFGNLNTATNFAGRLAEGIIFLGENIDQVVLGATALAGAFALNFAIAQVATLNRTILTLGATALGVFTNLARALRNIVTLFGLINVQVLRSPLFIGGALIIGTLTLAFIALQDVIKSLIPDFEELGDAFNAVADFTAAVIITILDSWRDLFPALLDITIRGLNVIIEQFTRFGGKIGEFFNDLFDTDLFSVDTAVVDAIANPVEGAFERIISSFQQAQQEVRESGGGFEALSSRFDEIRKRIDEIVNGPQINREALFGTPPNDAASGADEVTKAFTEASDALRSLEASVSPAVAAFNELVEARETLSEAQKEGVASLIEEEELLRRIRREQLGVGNALTDAAEKQRLLNQALREGIVTTDEAEQATRRFRLEALEDDRTLGAGIERAFLRLTDQATDTGAQIEELLGQGFKAAEDALVSFVQTGEVDLQNLGQSLSEFFLRLAAQQAQAAIGGFFTGGFGLGGPQGQAGAPLGGALGGLGGIITGIGSSLFGFQTGGSFQVNSQTAIGSTTGADNRVVAFRAQDGETVSVSPRGGGRGGGVMINFNISTPNADSFRRQQTEITRTAFNAARAEQDRSGG